MTADDTRYATAAAFRMALEERLRRRAQDTGFPLDRLRKEVAYQRLLARLAATAPDGAWALKGGLVLVARLGETARATKDADTTWRAQLDELATVIEAMAETDLRDGFEFEIAAPQPLGAETDEGGLRYPVLALLDGREFERLQLDVNVVPNDPRPVDRLQLRDLLGFAGIHAPALPVISPGQHLAEKLHAYTRDYPGGESSRPRDLFDMLVIAQSIPLPDADSSMRHADRRSRSAIPRGHPRCQHPRQAGRPSGRPTSGTMASRWPHSTTPMRPSSRSGIRCS